MKPEKEETNLGHELTRRKFIGLIVATSGAAISAPYLAGLRIREVLHTSPMQRIQTRA